jgi:hypothetical protein
LTVTGIERGSIFGHGKRLTRIVSLHDQHVVRGLELAYGRDDK